MVNTMCTCLNCHFKNNYYFGRNLDLDYSFNEKIIITPRNYQIKFKKEKSLKNHFAFIGSGTIIDNYPLYAEACNEKGLSMAMLNFPDNCCYYKYDKNKRNYAPYELVLIILSTCKSLKEVKELLSNTNVININFASNVLLTPQHFMISYKGKSITVETLKDGLHIYDNIFNVLTNNPIFLYHQENITNYLKLQTQNPINTLNKNINIKPISYGQGALGLPGDYSSISRFVKCFFISSNMILNEIELNNINQFIKCLDSVMMIKGIIKAKYGFEYTRYSCCINTTKQIYYYKTYDNPTLNAINMHKENLNRNDLICYEMITDLFINKQN